MSQQITGDPEMSLGRVEAFTDGVFAVAVTLLILNIQVPHVPEGAEPEVLIDLLLKQWPAYLGYLLTFITLGSVWIANHRLLRFLQAVDETFQIINLLFLMFVTLTPFTTALLAEYLQQPNKIRIATTIYGVTWGIMGLLTSGMWHYAKRANFLKPNLDPIRIRQVTVQFGIGSVFGFFAMLLALISPAIGIALYVLIALAYLRPILRVFRPLPQKTTKQP